VTDLSDRLQIDTPENVLLDAEIAGFGSRCAAGMIDYTILLVILLIVGLIYLQVTRNSNNQYVALALFGLIYILITFYHLFFEFLWNGQTPGKRLLGLRVVQTNGLPLTSSSGIIRNLVRLFDFLPAFYGVGLIAMFASRHTQRLGDLAGGTYVIREQKQITAEAVSKANTITYHHVTRTSELPAYINIAALTETDRYDVVDYLQRRVQILRREFVVVLLAKRIAAKMGEEVVTIASRSALDAETFLEQVAMASERASQPSASSV